MALFYFVGQGHFTQGMKTLLFPFPTTQLSGLLPSSHLCQGEVPWGWMLVLFWYFSNSGKTVGLKRLIQMKCMGSPGKFQQILLDWHGLMN